MQILLHTSQILLHKRWFHFIKLRFCYINSRLCFITITSLLEFYHVGKNKIPYLEDSSWHSAIFIHIPEPAVTLTSALLHFLWFLELSKLSAIFQWTRIFSAIFLWFSAIFYRNIKLSLIFHSLCRRFSNLHFRQFSKVDFRQKYVFPCAAIT